MKEIKDAGFDGIILNLPVDMDKEQMRSLVYYAVDSGLKVIFGGTAHLANRKREGGFVLEQDGLDTYLTIAEAGITHMVVPTNNPQVVQALGEAVQKASGVHPIFYAAVSPPKSENGEVQPFAYQGWHTVVGEKVYNQEKGRSIRDAACEAVRHINGSSASPTPSPHTSPAA